MRLEYRVKPETTIEVLVKKMKEMQADNQDAKFDVYMESKNGEFFIIKERYDDR